MKTLRSFLRRWLGIEHPRTKYPVKAFDDFWVKVTGIDNAEFNFTDRIGGGLGWCDVCGRPAILPARACRIAWVRLNGSSAGILSMCNAHLSRENLAAYVADVVAERRRAAA